MDDEIINDLKQFITASLSQHFSDVARKSDLDDVARKSDIEQSEKRLEKKIDDLSTHVAEALDTSNDAVQSQLSDHEQRIGKLEQASV